MLQKSIVYGLRDRDFSKYCEYLVAFKLQKSGWEVFHPFLDRYIDLVAIKEIDGKFILRTIQVKGSRVELEGEKESYGIDHRPKDLMHDPCHFFIWVLFDKNGKVNYAILSVKDFVNLKGTGINTKTWRANRGRFHPHSDLRALRDFIDDWKKLDTEEKSDVAQEVLNAQEIDAFWKKKGDVISKWKDIDKKVFELIPKEMEDKINRKTTILKWKIEGYRK
jgi:hypothetical protein